MCALRLESLALCPGHVSGGGGRETLRENTGGAIPRESSWMHGAQTVDWSGEITLKFLENRGDIWQIQYWEASWKQYKWIVIVRVLETNYYSQSWNTHLMKAKFTLSARDFLSIRKVASFVNASE